MRHLLSADSGEHEPTFPAPVIRELVQYGDLILDPETGDEYYDLGDRIEAERFEIPEGAEVAIDVLLVGIRFTIKQGKA